MLTLATVAVLLAVAPLVSEMAYASRGGAGIRGTPGHALTHVTCTSSGCTASSSATGATGGGGGSGDGPSGGPGGAGARGTGISTSVVSPPSPPTPQPCTVFGLC
jgi:hypothetical protein